MKPERHILQILSSAHPRMLKDTVLRAEMALELGEMSMTDLKRHLLALEGKKQVVVINGEDATRIKITTDGLARLAE